MKNLYAFDQMHLLYHTGITSHLWTATWCKIKPMRHRKHFVGRFINLTKTKVRWFCPLLHIVRSLKWLFTFQYKKWGWEVYVIIIQICRVIQLLRKPQTICDNFDIWISRLYGIIKLDIISWSMNNKIIKKKKQRIKSLIRCITQNQYCSDNFFLLNSWVSKFFWME